MSGYLQNYYSVRQMSYNLGRHSRCRGEWRNDTNISRYLKQARQSDLRMAIPALHPVITLETFKHAINEGGSASDALAAHFFL